MCVENKDNGVMYLKAILKSTGAGSTSGREDQFFLKCENFRKYFNCPSTSIITSTFASNHCLTSSCVYFPYASLNELRNQMMKALLLKTHVPFWKSGEIVSKTELHYLGDITLVLWIPEISTCEGFPLVLLIFYTFCNRCCFPPVIRSLEEVETSVMCIPAESTKPFKLFFSLNFIEQWLLNAFVYLASHIFTSLLRKR